MVESVPAVADWLLVELPELHCWRLRLKQWVHWAEVEIHLDSMLDIKWAVRYSGKAGRAARHWPDTAELKVLLIRHLHSLVVKFLCLLRGGKLDELIYAFSQDDRRPWSRILEQNHRRRLVLDRCDNWESDGSRLNRRQHL